MKATKLLPYFVISGLILIILLQRECNPLKVDPLVITKDTTIYQIDTLTFNNTVYLPKPYKVIDTLFQHDTIFRTKYDTVTAVKDYSLYRKYDLALINDSAGIMNCLVDVQFNKVAKYQLKGTLYDRTKIVEHNHYVVEEKRNKVFAGLQLGYSIPDTTMLVAPTLQFLTKKDHLYSVSYEPFRRIAEVGIFWKIQFKK